MKGGERERLKFSTGISGLSGRKTLLPSGKLAVVSVVPFNSIDSEGK
jgi:hypothetical protein